MTLLATSGTGHRSRSLIVSLGLHTATFWGLMQAPTIEIPKRSPTEYRQAIAGKEEKLVWYKFRKELPAVTPPNSTSKRPLRAEVVSKQSIVSSAEAPKRTQMVWTPAPEIAPAAPLESPNLIAVKLPGPKPFTAPPDIVRPPAPNVELPAPPEIETKAMPKQFVQPVETRREATRQPTVATEAPAIAASPVQAVELTQRRLPGKTFVRPESAQAKLVSPVRPLEDAPEVGVTGEKQATLLPGTKLPPKPFNTPTQTERPAARQVARVDDAPGLMPSSTGLTGTGLASPKLPPKPFAGTLPARTGEGRATAPAAPMEAPTDAEALNVAIVGIRPADTAVTLPSASSPASFASGPKLRADGADSEAGVPGIVVPGLFVRGPVTSGRELAAQAHAAPTAHETLAAVIRRGEPVAATVREAPAAPSSSQNGATRVASSPDPRLNGRETYMMAIQMPNLTSFSGSWLLWYAARTATQAAASPLAPPIAHRKVDPKYLPAAVAERIEGNVQLACQVDVEGHVSRVQLIRGVDDRLNQSATEALSKWEFYPATRNGEPVAVDVVVEIPFRVAPLRPRKF